MKPLLCYPIPAESRKVWDEFRPFIARFTDSINKYPGDCTVALVCSWNSGSEVSLDEIYALEECLPNTDHRFRLYGGYGCDIGGAQFVAKNEDPFRLMIMLTSRCYFHRDGWLERYVESHKLYPDALLGASASWEGGKRHICTRAYAMRAGLFASYPHIVNSREDGTRFEIGDECITDWFYANERNCLQVTFDGIQWQPEWRRPDNIYRKGDQSNMLVWDRHSDYYRDAGPEEQEKLRKLADGV